ncbi:MAG: hypothetical protein H0U82_07320 [Actinobacteria bacterium]|nr:hypothetical protein [Actinomycetota bacterium]
MAIADERAARERKQKIFVAVGGVVLLLLLAIQLPKLLGGSGTSEATETTATSPDTVGAEPVPGIGARPVSVVLVDTDRPLPAARGKLTSFTVFSRKDPFVQQVKPQLPPTSLTAGAAGTKDGGGEKPKTDSTGFTVGTPVASVTVISVNGARQALLPGAAFPSSNPVFVLIAEQPKAKTVTIGIAGGVYENGAKGTKLKVGKPLVLVNTTTGASYRLVLVAVGDGSAAAARAADQSSGKPPAATP